MSDVVYLILLSHLQLKGCFSVLKFWRVFGSYSGWGRDQKYFFYAVWLLMGQYEAFSLDGGVYRRLLIVRFRFTLLHLKKKASLDFLGSQGFASGKPGI